MAMIPKKVMVIFGTRPEAIKLAPIVLAMGNDRNRFEPYIVATGQHDEMLSQVLHHFRVKPDKNLEIMTPGQTLSDVTTRALKGLESNLREFRPDIVLVQGDTTTAFAAALAAYYEQIPVAHVEAGLRTNNKYNPFPEEINRRLITGLADLHFAPTEFSARQLRLEGIPDERIFVTGNTVIDALRMAVRKDYVFKDNVLNTLDYKTRKVIVLTMHRRESFGDPMRSVMEAVRQVAKDYEEVEVVFPVHFNPNVRRVVREALGETRPKNIHLVDPLEYQAFIQLMDRSYLILTDSGGLQEEAPALGKPVLVLRETTERPEGIQAGTARIVGTKTDRIYSGVQELLEDTRIYQRMARAGSPYGDGRASERILDILQRVDVGMLKAGYKIGRHDYLDNGSG